MKKLVLATLLTAAMSTAHAVDLGVNSGWDNAGKKGDNTLGVSVAVPVSGPLGVAVELDQRSELDRVGVLGTYEVTKLFGAQVVAKAGVALVNPDRGNNRLVSQVGLGATFPLVSKLSLSADVRYRVGEGNWDGTHAFAGLVYKF